MTALAIERTAPGSGDRNAAEIEAMRRFLAAARGGFSLAIAVYSTVGARDGAIGAMLDSFPDLASVRLGPEDRDVLSSVRAACDASQPPAAFVLDLERAVPFDDTDQPALRALNASRDLWDGLRCPVIIWLPEYAVGLLARKAPDLWRYRSHTFEFAGEPSEPIEAEPISWPDYAHVDGLPYEAKKARVAELEGRLADLPDPVPESLRAHVTTWETELAYLYRLFGDYARSEGLYRRLLATDEASYGPEHPSVAARLNDLAQLLQATNRLAEAEPLMRRAVRFFERSLGEQHPTVATALSNLAALLMATKRFAEAEPLVRRALTIREATYGPGHPKVGVALNNVAQLLKATKRPAEAEPLMRRALAIDEASYGPEHPAVATALGNLATLLRDTGRLAEAEPLSRKALVIDEASYGPEHPKVAIRLNNLAQLLQATNRLAEAEPHMRRALAIDEASYGPEHPKVAIRLNNLGLLLMVTHRLAEAKPLMRRNLEILVAFWRATGHEHPHLRDAIDNFGGLLLEMGRAEEQAAEEISNIIGQ